MDGKINRRQTFGVLAGAALSLRPRSAEAKANAPEFLPSPLLPEELEQQKSRAAEQLVESFWDNPKAREHITRSFFDGVQGRSEIHHTLMQESQMYIPTPEKGVEMQRKYRQQLSELSKHVPEKKYGLFLDGDEQTLYVMNNIGGNKIQFAKAYPVSTSRDGWNNRFSSGGTPLGLHYIAEGRRGMLGEVVANSQRDWKNYAQIPPSEKSSAPTKTLVGTLFDKTNTVPEVVTSSFLIVGPTTPPTRAIFIHGTNRLAMLGRPDSGGCIRLSNVDIYDLGNYIDIEMGKLLEYGKKMPVIRGGTPVMISASGAVSNVPKSEQGSDRRVSKTSKSRPEPRRVENLLDEGQWKKYLKSHQLKDAPKPKPRKSSRR